MIMTSLPKQYVSLDEELKRNPQLKMSDLQMLKDWVNKQPHLPDATAQDLLYLVFFYHSNYYCMEPTKRTIDNFFTVRTHTPEIFSNRDPIAWKGLRKAFTVASIVPLEQETKEGYIMTFGKFLDTDTSKFDQNELVKYLLMTCEIQNLIRGTSNGQVVILDAAGLSLGHIGRLHLASLKKTLYYVQEAAPVRLKAIHVLNMMPIVDTLYSMIKPFLKAEMIQLIHFHSSMETVKEFLPIEALPNEYGGEAGSIAEITARHIKVLEEFREYFQYDEQIGRVNESLRVGKFEHADSLFGADGSFKKLEID